VINSQNWHVSELSRCKTGCKKEYVPVPVVIVPTDVPFNRRLPVEEFPAEVIATRNVPVIPLTPVMVGDEAPNNENAIDGVEGVQYTLNRENPLISAMLLCPVVTGLTTKNALICPVPEKL
jgi:hypothetical protein